MQKNLVAGLLGALAIAAPMAASNAVGGPYAVDTADLTASGRCQIQAWYARADRDSETLGAVPACAPSDRLELALGLSRRQLAGAHDTLIEAGAKTLFRELTAGGYGWGLALTSSYGGALERLEGAAVYVPLSIHVLDEMALHYNLGWAHVRDEADAWIWGVRGDYRLNPHFNLIGEAYGSHRGGTELQLGLRYRLGPAALDLAYGRARSHADDNWTTFGFSWAF